MFLKNRDTTSERGDTYNRYNVSLRNQLVFSTVITMSEQVVPSAVTQRIVVKFLTK
jgi:hypothetical protein